MSMMNPYYLKFIQAIFTMCLMLQVYMYLVCAKEVRCIQRERQALLHFKAALVDDYGMLSSWTSEDCCQWKGIRCSNLTGHVLMLDLHGETIYSTDRVDVVEVLSQVYISGKIHESVIELQQLKYLNLSWNTFPDSHIPDFLGSLSNLRYLDLFYSRFGGKIPSQFGSLSHLKYLNLGSNLLEGSIPCQLGNLSNLHYLDLSFNFLEGHIPSQLGNLSNLHYLDLSFNFLEGHIPSQLGRLSNLQQLNLGRYEYALKIDDGGQWLSNLTFLTHLRLISIYNLGGYHNALKTDNENLFAGQWLSNLTSLTHLNLYSISNLNSSRSWMQMIGKLPKLRELSLSECGLSDHFILSLNPSQFNSSTSLSVLDLSSNAITSSMIFQWVSNFSSNLVELDLGNNLLEAPPSNHFGTMMKSLERLYLSRNRLKGGALKSFMNICTLRSLRMSTNNLNEDLPSILQNLSQGCVRYSLQELDLHSNQIMGSLPNLSIFSSLKMLDLSENQLSGKIPEGNILPSQLEDLSISSNFLEGGIPKLFGSTCSLGSLDLSNNHLSEELAMIFETLSGCARYSLKELELGGNEIYGTLPDLSIFSNLKRLYLWDNQLNGKIPEGSKLPSQLEHLSIGSNSLEGGIPKSFGNACTLYSIDLSNNSLSEELPVIIHHLSRCARYSLQTLDLSMNQISGTLPDLSIFSSLKRFDLSGNKLNGTISDSHFANMSKLESLELSDNSLALTFTQNWVPPFQLIQIGLRSCKLGVAFPKWLQTQNNFGSLDISNTGISDIVPHWFWAKLPHVMDINISHNNLRGIIPDFPLKNTGDSLSLASNQFEGPIPSFLRSFVFLDLSKNNFSGSHSFLCANGTVETLYQLDLSNNQLSGQIPDCWNHFQSLTYLDLSHNNFSGKIPTSLGSLLELQVLILRNNCLTEEIPFSLRSCTKLVMLDVGENRLSGPIPSWIGSKLQELQVLSLAKNHFFRSLPLQLCYLKNIKLLDLSLNNLSGQIPKCFKNFTSMAQKTSSRDYPGHWYIVNTTVVSGSFSYELNAFLMWKGEEQIFKNNGLFLLKSIDLSSNHFSGEVPVEIENLFELVSLNLSRNNLSGKIPSNIGRLTSLEFLDLSRNQIFGSIPSSLTQIDRLAVLDLSHNHLSGEIPTSTQLQSFNASSFEDNLDLCGPPLEKLCIEGEQPQEPTVNFHENEDLLFSRGFYISMAFGFIIGFWGIFGSILVKRSWRHAYFKFLNNLMDNIYVMVAVRFAKYKRSLKAP